MPYRQTKPEKQYQSYQDYHENIHKEAQYRTTHIQNKGYTDKIREIGDISDISNIQTHIGQEEQTCSYLEYLHDFFRRKKKQIDKSQPENSHPQSLSISFKEFNYVRTFLNETRNELFLDTA
jgi:hypothetical protein